MTDTIPGSPKALLEKVAEEARPFFNRPKPFNLISILMNESDEVNLHSRFLADLLSPQGRHGKKTLFLDRLLAMIKWQDFCTKEVRVECERDKIDILLTNSRRQAIIFENKINALDQHRQLPRYVEALQKRRYEVLPEKNIRLIYLTKYGHSPSSEAELGEMGLSLSLNCLSYRENIRDWLEECLKLVESDTPLRESLAMYLNVVLRLTKQSGIPEMDKKINDILLDPINLRAGIEIAKQVREVKIELQYRFWDWLNKSLSEAFDDRGMTWDGRMVEVNRRKIERYYSPGARNRNFYGMETNIDTGKNGVKLCFRVEIHNRIYFGIRIPKNNPGQSSDTHINKDTLIKIAKNIKSSMESSDHWIAKWYTDPELNWRDFNLDRVDGVGVFMDKEKGKDCARKIAENMADIAKNLLDQLRQAN